MMKLWLLLGRITAWIIRPYIKSMVNGSRRSRVLITHKEEVLLSIDWLGPQNWSIPGGDIKETESDKDSAIREVKEELRLDLVKKDTVFIDEFIQKSPKLSHFFAVLFHVELKNKQAVSPHMPEVVAVKWFKISQLPTGVDPLVELAISKIRS